MKDLTLYVTSSCPYCHAAVNFVKQKNYPHQVVSLDGQGELRDKLSRENQGWRTVPMIFIGAEFVGGYTDLMKLAEQGTLENKLNG